MVNSTALSPKEPSTAELFPSRERWGWRFRDLSNAAVDSFPSNRPYPTMPELPDESSFSKAQARRRIWFILLSIGIFMACWIYALTTEPQPGGDFTLTGWLLMNCGILAAGATLYLGIWLSHRAFAHFKINLPGYQPWIMHYAAHLQEYAELDHAWKRARTEHDENMRRELQNLPEWGVLRPRRTAGRVDVYGGTLFSWEAWIFTLGASILGSGSSLSIIDLTQNGVTRALYNRSKQHGRSTWKLLLPEQQKNFNLLSDMSKYNITDMFVEALHSDDKEENKEGRAIDTRIIRGICDCLTQPPTIQLIHEGMLVLLREKQVSKLLKDEERAKIFDLFQEVYFSQIQKRLVDLETTFYSLCLIDQQNDSQGASSQGDQDLRIIELSEAGATLQNDIFVNLLIQHQIRHLRSQSQKRPDSQAIVLMVAGVDNLKTKHLERLDNLSKRQGVRLIYLFEHLRRDALEILGGNSTTVFMQLGNPEEAEVAAEYIGRGYKFIMNGFGTHEDRNVTNTTGTSEEFTTGSSGHLPWWADSWSSGHSEGTNQSQSSGVTKGASRNYERAYEFELEPTALQNLEEMAMLFVEKGLKNDQRMPLEQTSGKQRVQIGYCDPDILLLTRKSPDPLPSWEDGGR